VLFIVLKCMVIYKNTENIGSSRAVAKYFVNSI